MFPKDFLWGTATSGHQVEGNNIDSDWWEFERCGGSKDLSGQACRHYELFDQDFQLAKNLHQNAHRFSVEWSRAEPQENRFNNHAISHYRDVIRSLRSKTIEPFVTLHHFTNPIWFAKQGGWLNPESPAVFCRYVERIVESLGEGVQWWVTVNEPLVLAYYGYVEGIWPPAEKSLKKAWQVIHNLIQAHRLAYETIHKIYQKNKWPQPQVSAAANLVCFKVCPQSRNPFCYLGVFLRHRLFNLYFLEKIKTAMDFIGVNYYARHFISNDKKLAYGPFGGKCNVVHGHVGHLNTLFWDSYPEGLFEVLTWLKRFSKPIVITENGTCEDNDQYRIQFLKEHISQIKKALDAKIPVAGYFYWSLMDNFEWHYGFRPRFGLLEVDYRTYQRTPRKSALWYSELCRENSL